MSDPVASADDTLVRCFTPPVEVLIDIWLMTTERLRHEPHVRALMDFFAGYLANARYLAHADWARWTLSPAAPDRGPHPPA
jgi:hypothetical protein